MKKITIRFYEELNDFLPKGKKKIRFEHSFSGNLSVKDMIESLGVPHTGIDLILVNGNSVNLGYIIKNHDDISVYPVFESINITDIQNLRPKPLRTPVVILDVHLGKLAKLMRLLGFDTLYENHYDDIQIVEIAICEKRTILTRDTGLLKRKEVTRGYFVRNVYAEKQLKEIILRFDLRHLIKPFSRCLICNNLLKPIPKKDILSRIPMKVRLSQNDFFICDICNKIYWKGDTSLKWERTISRVIKKNCSNSESKIKRNKATDYEGNKKYFSG